MKSLLIGELVCLADIVYVFCVWVLVCLELTEDIQLSLYFAFALLGCESELLLRDKLCRSYILARRGEPSAFRES